MTTTAVHLPANALERYRQNRAAGMPAQWAYRAATAPTLEDRYPGFPWHVIDMQGDTPGTVTTPDGRWSVTVSVGYDEYAEPFGRFTDTPGPDTITHPSYRGDNRRDTFRYYAPASGSLDEHRRSLSAMGYSRHDAYTRALSNLRREAMADASPERYSVTVDVAAPCGVHLASASLHGVDGGDTYAQDRAYVADVAGQLLDEAMPDAVAALERVRTGRKVHVVTVGDLESAAGRRLSDDEVGAIGAALRDALPAVVDGVVAGVTR